MYSTCWSIARGFLGGAWDSLRSNYLHNIIQSVFFAYFTFSLSWVHSAVSMGYKMCKIATDWMQRQTGLHSYFLLHMTLKRYEKYEEMLLFVIFIWRTQFKNILLMLTYIEFITVILKWINININCSVLLSNMRNI